MLNDIMEGTKTLVIYLIMNDVIDGITCIPHVFQTQIQSLQGAGCTVHLGLIDDRTSIPGIIRNTRRIAMEIDRVNPDLVVANYGSVTAAVARVAKGNHPLLIFFRGSDILGTSEGGVLWRLRDQAAKWLGIWAANAAQSIIVNGEVILAALPEDIRPHVACIPNGTDTDVFRPMNRSECRTKLGWEIDSQVVLFNASAGSSQLIKNPDLARKAVEYVSNRMPKVRLQVMSSCSREQVAMMMNAADCLLITSFHEGSPDIVKEAMACNLPVVSVPCGDVPERLAGTIPSFVCPYEPEALGEAIRKVFQSSTRSNGRQQLLAQELDVNSITRRLMSVFSLAVNRKQESWSASISNAKGKLANQ